ncbi:MAG: sodium:solute symporter family protein [Planctomycetes bacterium]|nr:sodium:solute symporter family protein [Planctomycetota bacterium]
MSPLLLGVALYIVVQLLIGIVVARRVRNEDDYLVAGRSMGYVLSTFSIFATWFGAEACSDAAGEVYENGLSWSSTEPYAYGIALALAGLWLAAPLWSKKLTTLADLFRVRYSHGVERLAAVLLIPTSLFWAAAQIRVFGHVISGASELGNLPAMALAAGVVIVYTTFGGMLADAVTDVVQGIALIIGLAVLLFGVTSELGGTAAALESIDASRFHLAPGEQASWLELLETWSLPILGSLVAQELIARMSSARSGRVARRSAVVAGMFYAAVGSMPVALGLLGPKLLPGLDAPDELLPQLARTHLSTIGFTLFAGALVSAILSTVDSALLVSSSLFSHNIVGRLRPDLDERSKLRVARTCTIAFGLVSFALASTPSSVGDLIDLTNGFGSAGVFVLLVFGLFTRIGGAGAALGALLSGAGLFSIGYLREWSFPYLTALGGALAAYLALALVSKAPNPVDALKQGT